MGRGKLRVIQVGLKLFNQRLEKQLNDFDPTLKTTALDTYGSKWDKLRAMILIPFSDVLYSINGTLSNSGVVNWALFWNKKVMFTWVGTDVTQALGNENPVERYKTECSHYCEVDWIREELQTIGIEAEILNFFNFDKDVSTGFQPNSRLQVLSYIAKNSEQFYGWEKLIRMAEACPEIDFTIVGTDGAGLNYPDNVECKGWVQNMEEEFEKAHVTARLPEHDGLSGFVLESLLREKYVLYSHPYDHCIHVDSSDGISELKELLQKLAKHELQPNKVAREFVLREFDRERILTSLITEMRKPKES